MSWLTLVEVSGHKAEVNDLPTVSWVLCPHVVGRRIMGLSAYWTKT